jgi:hypothetical protein
VSFREGVENEIHMREKLNGENPQRGNSMVRTHGEKLNGENP